MDYVFMKFYEIARMYYYNILFKQILTYFYWSEIYDKILGILLKTKKLNQ